MSPERSSERPILCHWLNEALELLRARGQHRHELHSTLLLPAIDPVEHEQVEVHVEIERTAEWPYQGHGTSSRTGVSQAGLADQMALKSAGRRYRAPV